MLFAEENLKIISKDIFFLEWKWMNGKLIPIWF